MNRWTASLVSILCLSLVVGNATADAPKVELVIGNQATSLEKLAAEDIAADLKKIYGAQVTISTMVSDGAAHLIFVGRPESLPIIQENVKGNGRTSMNKIISC